MPCVTELLETGDVHPDGEALMGVWSFSPREVAENGAAAGRQECQDVIDLFDMFDMFRAGFSSHGLDEAWTHARDSTRTTSSPMREGSRRGPRGIAPVREGPRSTPPRRGRVQGRSWTFAEQLAHISLLSAST